MVVEEVEVVEVVAVAMEVVVVVVEKVVVVEGGAVACKQFDKKIRILLVL